MESLENEMPFNGVEQKTTNLFQYLMNKAYNELYLGCS